MTRFAHPPAHRLSLRLHPGRLAVCRTAPECALPDWALQAGGLLSITRTQSELSIVCAEDAVPAGVRSEGGWRALEVEGPLEFSLTGVLLSLLQPLAVAGVSIFAVSTFDTDYVLVGEANLERALAALKEAGHTVGAAGPKG